MLVSSRETMLCAQNQAEPSGEPKPPIASLLTSTSNAAAGLPRTFRLTATELVAPERTEMESRVGLSGAVNATISGAVNATESAADNLPRALSPPADRAHTHGLGRSETDRDGNSGRRGSRQLAADNQFAAG